jgi:hypothetical protein
MSIDPNRPGPPLPGAAAGPEQAAVTSPVTPLAARSDPLAPAREQALWWGLAAVGLCALALVVRPWLGGVRLGRRTTRGRRRRTPDVV